MTAVSQLTLRGDGFVLRPMVPSDARALHAAGQVGIYVVLANI